MLPFSFHVLQDKQTTTNSSYHWSFHEKQDQTPSQIKQAQLKKKKNQPKQMQKFPSFIIAAREWGDDWKAFLFTGYFLIFIPQITCSSISSQRELDLLQKNVKNMLFN